MSPWNTIWTVALKDWRLEWRSRDSLTATVFFAGLVLLILGFALGPSRQRLQQAAPGILWTALAFSSVLAAQRSFGSEQEAGALEALTLYPVAHEWIYLGKLLGNYGQLLVLGALLTPLCDLLFGLPAGPRWPELLLTLLLGLLGLSVIGCFYAAVTTQLRAREALLPVLIFPVVVPVILASVKATCLLTTGGLGSEVRSWLGLLVVFDLIYLVCATLIFPYALEG